MNNYHYFSRFAALAGFSASPSADFATLSALHQRWPALIPFENIEVLLGRPVSIDVEKIADKLLSKQRGGYCFEHNLLLRQILEEIGFRVTPHLARVLWGQDKPDATPQTHMLLTVALDGVRYLADVGFGGVSLTAPLRLEAGEQQGYRLERFSQEEWLLSMKSGGSWRLMYRFADGACEQADILVASHIVATYDESLFRHNLMMAKIINGQQTNLFNRHLTVYGEEKRQQEAASFTDFRALILSFFTADNVLSETEIRAIYEKVG